MKLADALSRRSDAQKRYQQLKARATAVAVYQEGEEPAEDAAALLEQADAALADLERLIRDINRTNAAARLADGRTITDAIAERDVLRLRHRLYTEVADAASGTGDQYSQPWMRQMRSELRNVSAVDVGALRHRADDTAVAYRELDVTIQEANWSTELLEDND